MPLYLPKNNAMPYPAKMLTIGIIGCRYLLKPNSPTGDMIKSPTIKRTNAEKLERQLISNNPQNALQYTIINMIPKIALLQNTNGLAYANCIIVFIKPLWKICPSKPPVLG